MNPRILFSRPIWAPTNRQPETKMTSPLRSTIGLLVNMQATCSQFSAFAAENDRRVAAQIAGDVDLSTSACQAFADVRSNIEYARALEAPLRERARVAVQDAVSDANRCADRIRKAHADIDLSIRDVVVAGLPDELVGLEVTCEAERPTQQNALMRVVSGTKELPLPIISVPEFRWFADWPARMCSV